MKNLFCFILLTTIMISCKVTQNTEKNLVGTYTAKGKDYNYKLILNSDNTFNLKFKSLEANSGCEGNWKLNGTKTIVLACNEPRNIEETLQGGYMTNRVQELTVKSKERLQYNGIILKRD